jgi:hypothetical protein
MTWDLELERRLRAKYAPPAPRTVPPARPTRAWATGDGFVTESSGRVVLTAPAATFDLAGELPPELATRWQQQSTANPYFTWIQGRFVEAGQANGNGALWTTGDLQFGEMGVAHGPLNWLHESRKVIGTIADARLVHPAPAPELAAAARPYIAATAAVWKWIYPGEAADLQRASDARRLYYSMECVAERVQCAGEAGCGESFDYLAAMTDPASTCGHIRDRSSSRRMVNPSFLGGAVIVPPVRPGWKDASASVMRQAAHLAEETASANSQGLTASEWEALMAAVIDRTDAR